MNLGTSKVTSVQKWLIIYFYFFPDPIGCVETVKGVNILVVLNAFILIHCPSTHRYQLILMKEYLVACSCFWNVSLKRNFSNLLLVMIKALPSAVGPHGCFVVTICVPHLGSLTWMQNLHLWRLNGYTGTVSLSKGNVTLGSKIDTPVQNKRRTEYITLSYVK